MSERLQNAKTHKQSAVSSDPFFPSLDAEGTICNQDELIARLQSRIRGLEESLITGSEMSDTEAGSSPKSGSGSAQQPSHAASLMGIGSSSLMATRSGRGKITIPEPSLSPSHTYFRSPSSINAMTYASRPMSASPIERVSGGSGQQSTHQQGSSYRPASAVSHWSSSRDVQRSSGQVHMAGDMTVSTDYSRAPRISTSAGEGAAGRRPSSTIPLPSLIQGSHQTETKSPESTVAGRPSSASSHRKTLVLLSRSPSPYASFMHGLDDSSSD